MYGVYFSFFLRFHSDCMIGKQGFHATLEAVKIIDEHNAGTHDLYTHVKNKDGSLVESWSLTG